MVEGGHAHRLGGGWRTGPPGCLAGRPQERRPWPCPWLAAGCGLWAGGGVARALRQGLVARFPTRGDVALPFPRVAKEGSVATAYSGSRHRCVMLLSADVASAGPIGLVRAALCLRWCGCCSQPGWLLLAGRVRRASGILLRRVEGLLTGVLGASGSTRGCGVRGRVGQGAEPVGAERN